MKKMFLLAITIACMFFVQSISASNWTRTTIKNFQISAARTSIYVHTQDPINFPGCESTNSMYLINNDTLPNFDEIFSMLMLAKAQGSEISILITGNPHNGKCSPNLNTVHEPTIRFH